MQFAVWIAWNMAGIVHRLFEKLGDAWSRHVGFYWRIEYCLYLYHVTQMHHVAWALTNIMTESSHYFQKCNRHMKQTSSIKSQRVLFPSPFRFSARLHSLFMHCLNQLANRPAYHATLSANCFLFLWKQPKAQKILCTCGFVIESNSVSFQIPDARVQMAFHACTRSELWFPPSGIRT
jgi:hypothetical protein